MYFFIFCNVFFFIVFVYYSFCWWRFFFLQCVVLCGFQHPPKNICRVSLHTKFFFSLFSCISFLYPLNTTNLSWVLWMNAHKIQYRRQQRHSKTKKRIISFLSCDSFFALTFSFVSFLGCLHLVFGWWWRRWQWQWLWRYQGWKGFSSYLEKCRLDGGKTTKNHIVKMLHC